MVRKQKNIWLQNFVQPDGLVGRLVGNHMASENLEVNLWTTAMLNIGLDEKILEIGFGPGIAIQDMAERAPHGFIAGIDYSELMVKTAKTRNKKAIVNGRVDLRHADVCNIPDFGVKFDKIVTINNIMYWPHAPYDLRDLRKFLKPGGSISIVLQRNEMLVKSGQCMNEVQTYMKCLALGGYTDVQVISHPIVLNRPKKRDILFGILLVGTNPAVPNAQQEAVEGSMELIHCAKELAEMEQAS